MFFALPCFDVSSRLEDLRRAYDKIYKALPNSVSDAFRGWFSCCEVFQDGDCNQDGVAAPESLAFCKPHECGCQVLTREEFREQITQPKVARQAAQQSLGDCETDFPSLTHQIF